jgi:hypothetical protein
MVSFRLAEEEFDLLQDACAVHGVDSISELARMAIYGLLLKEQSASGNLVTDLLDLRARTERLATDLTKLSQTVVRGGLTQARR